MVVSLLGTASICSDWGVCGGSPKDWLDAARSGHAPLMFHARSAVNKVRLQRDTMTLSTRGRLWRVVGGLGRHAVAEKSQGSQTR